MNKDGNQSIHLDPSSLPEEQTISVPQKKIKSKTWIILLCMIVLLFVSIAAGLFLLQNRKAGKLNSIQNSDISPTQALSPTSLPDPNLIVFTNKKCSYTFKYPKDLLAERTAFKEDIIGIYVADTMKRDGLGTDPVGYINIICMPTNISWEQPSEPGEDNSLLLKRYEFEQLLTVQVGESKEVSVIPESWGWGDSLPKYTFTRLDDVNIDGVVGKKFERKSLDNPSYPPETHIYLQKGRNIYLFLLFPGIGGYDGKYDLSSSQFDRIIKLFEFMPEPSTQKR